MSFSDFLAVNNLYPSEEDMRIRQEIRKQQEMEREVIASMMREKLFQLNQQTQNTGVADQNSYGNSSTSETKALDDHHARLKIRLKRDSAQWHINDFGNITEMNPDIKPEINLDEVDPSSFLDASQETLNS